jgi:putative addiction module killer protein
MLEIRRTVEFQRWLDGLGSDVAIAQISARLRRLAYGLHGDIKRVGDGVSELRIHTGPGYRLYLLQRAERLTILLCGGVKSSQRRDIARAKLLAENLETTQWH